MDGSREYHILSKVSQKEKDIPHDNTYMWNLKYDTNELIYKTETDSQTYKIDFWLIKGRKVGEKLIGSLGLADANCYIEQR